MWGHQTSPPGRKLLHFGAFRRRFKPPERPVLLPIPANSHTPGPMRTVAFVASSNYVMIGVESMASGHFFGDRDAFDANSLVALSDAPQVEVANGAQLAPTHRGVVPLRVRGHGAYAADDRTVMIQNVNYVPGFPCTAGSTAVGPPRARQHSRRRAARVRRLVEFRRAHSKPRRHGVLFIRARQRRLCYPVPVRLWRSSSRRHRRQQRVVLLRRGGAFARRLRGSSSANQWEHRPSMGQWELR